METKKIVAILVTIISGFYLLPAGIAIWKNHPKTIEISLVNFLLGWTLIGWVISLIWVLK